MCDTWTDSISTKEYTEFLEALVDHIIDTKSMTYRAIEEVQQMRRISGFGVAECDHSDVFRHIKNLMNPEGYWNMSTNLAKILQVKNKNEVSG